MPELSDRLIIHHDPRSPISEAFRTLRSNIQFASLDNPLNSLVITSTSPEEGKSTVAANLAIAVAMSGKNCVLCDADLRRPTIHKLFGLANTQGLTNLLIGGADLNVLADVGIPGLRVLPTGPLPPNPAELLGSSAMTRAIEALTGEVDIVIFDTPPVTAVTDAAILGSRVDGVILVVRLNKIPKPALLSAKSMLTNAKARIIGVVVNDVPPSKENGYYYYYYYD